MPGRAIQGWNDVSFHGSDQILTPNIDNLAYQGVILQQYYSEAICTPARTALLTGKYPMRLGMHGLPLYNSEDRGIPLTERLLPSYMKDLGYATHLIGKWHVGMSRREYLPTNRGYDSHYGLRGGGIDYYTYFKVDDWPNGRTMFGLDLFDNEIPQESETRYVVDALTERALRVINSHNTSQPLFLHLAHNAPHAGNPGASLQPPLYSSVKNGHIASPDRRLYAEMVTHLDQSIGQVVKALADKNILDDTIIVFASDNGAPTTGQYNNWGINLPFRGKKNTPWEGGVRVPAFIWHSSFRPRVWQGLMHITDWMPTLIAAAGGVVGTEIDGVNQWDSIVQDGESNRRELLLTIEDSLTNVYAAYRAGDYKIVVGNVTGVSNGYYGAEFLANKCSPPEYFPTLKTCDAAKALATLGMYLDPDEVQTIRRATAVVQQDTVRDVQPCLPSPTRGCLYNVVRDPTESHDLWLRANNIAALLTSRLRALWAQQLRRGPSNIQSQADPANFNYVWTPWLDQNSRTNVTAELKTKPIANKPNNSTIAIVVNCNGTVGIRNFFFHGSDLVQTPNIDMLAYTGVALERFYTHCLCMQGYPLVQSEDRYLPLDQKILPQYLKEIGYATHLVGKWHVGLSRTQALPTMRGFDSHFGHRGGYIDYYEYTLEELWNETKVSGYDLYRDMTPAWDAEGYITDLYNDEAKSIIARHDASSPLFLMVAHNAPHVGNGGAELQAPPGEVRRMRHIESQQRRILAAMIKKLDDSVGDIVKSLYKKGILNNTIIVFTSDNGGMPSEHTTNYGSNWPLRGTKMSPFEGGVRVVGLLWKANLNPVSRLWNGYMHISDWLPTLLRATGVDPPSDLDGFDQWANIISNKTSNRSEIFEIDDYGQGFYAIMSEEYKLITGHVTKEFGDYQGHDLNGDTGSIPSYTNALKSSLVYSVLQSLGTSFKIGDEKLRNELKIECNIGTDKRDKILCYPENGKTCLYNIKEDPCETKDLTKTHPETVSRLMERLEEEKKRLVPRTVVPVARDQRSRPSLHDFSWTTWADNIERDE
ncbi:hypothetical protein MSG28_002935 [Choristoneura fumiferana]|uniref:Uncharacterized protein n=1 Tax=Choristoneura fumiferana TaxID=7141 RepID=A0ACC0JK09_CHOFU|nr:hypothetical protein MSG28_002935 [Choristoneura fumiferana]